MTHQSSSPRLPIGNSPGMFRGAGSVSEETPPADASEEIEVTAQTDETSAEVTEEAPDQEEVAIGADSELDIEESARTISIMEDQPPAPEDDESAPEPPAPKVEDRPRNIATPKVPAGWPTAHGKPIPKSGWPAMWYGIKKAFGEPKVVPALNEADKMSLNAMLMQEERAAREAAARVALEQEFEGLGKDINWLLKVDKVTLILAAGNQDGGTSKTWTSNNLACEIAETARIQVAVVEGRRDSAIGIEMLGVDPEHTKSLRDLHAMREQLKSGTDYHHALSSNRYGVLGVKTDEEAPESDTFTGDEAAEDVKSMAKHIAVVILDQGNILTDDINLKLCGTANAGIFVSLPNRQSHTLCSRTAHTYATHGLQELVKHSFWMVNKLAEGDSPEANWEKIQGVMKPEALEKELQVFPKTTQVILGTHYDAEADYERSASSDLIVNLDRLQLLTRVELRRAAKKALELAKQHPLNNTPTPAEPSATNK